MVFFELGDENDFERNFPSVAEEKREQQERENTKLMLRILGELDQARENPPVQQQTPPMRVEYMRVGALGDIERDESEEEVLRTTKRKPGRVATLDDLPKESEFEMLFGKQPEPEPQLKVETGMRLKDGKVYHTAIFPTLENMSIDWSGISFDVLMLILAFVFFTVVVLTKIFKRARISRQRQQAIRAERERIDRSIEQRIELEVARRLAHITLV